ncbi:adenosylcobinamide-GDP ribazoletransferase [Janibacter cremeus]|uniref:Adenosylcobinamide-GDP ribazoletransferase n=1 Tax=Janibacter cremeus TaxID=1285192 RepID=A0A852VN87_9MICO|nr:adenosylcobinamide-GDP ribazoletransferase [Janibacter cremeus]
MSTLGDGLRLAVGTFTRIPSGSVTLDDRTARTALLLAPVAVLPLALVAGVIAAGVEVGLPPFVAAGLVLLVLAYGSRAMHLDGLADVVDAFGAGWDRDRALTVMRRGDIGPMGAAALVLTLLLQAGAITDLLGAGWRGAVVVAAAVLLSRSVCARLCATDATPAAGSRMAAAFVGTVPVLAAGALALVMAGVLALTALPQLSLLEGRDLLRGALMVLLALVLALLAPTLLRDKAVAVLGGVNGDVLGAAVEITLTTVLVVLTLAW